MNKRVNCVSVGQAKKSDLGIKLSTHGLNAYLSGEVHQQSTLMNLNKLIEYLILMGQGQNQKIYILWAGSEPYQYEYQLKVIEKPRYCFDHAKYNDRILAQYTRNHSSTCYELKNLSFQKGGFIRPRQYGQNSSFLATNSFNVILLFGSIRNKNYLIQVEFQSWTNNIQFQ